MAGIYSGPVPSRLVLLSDLRDFPPGEKLRFLGCVSGYSTQTAVLALEHKHPSHTHVKALVDVKLLVDTIKFTETRAGEWVNVIGYLTETNTTNSVTSTVSIQAVVLWPSGPLKLQDYERTLDRLKADQMRNMKHV